MAVSYGSALRKVRHGSVSFDGCKYYDDALKAFEGQYVEVYMVLLNDITKRKIYTSKGKFICEAEKK